MADDEDDDDLDHEPLEDWEELLERAEEQVRAGDLEEAMDTCEEAMALAPDEADVHLVRAQVALELGALDEAILSARKALSADEDDEDARAVLGLALFEACRVDEAESALSRVVARGTEDAEARFVLGVIAERAGRGEDAVRHFREAARLDPDFRFVKPLTREQFDTVVEDALAELPEDVARALENVSIQPDDYPPLDWLTETQPPFSPLLLGLFRGRTLVERSMLDGAPDLPPTVHLFQRNLELSCHTRAELVEQISITLVHEIGHYLGLDEDDLADRGID